MGWKVIEPNTHLKLNWHIEYIANRLQKEAERIANNQPKGKDIIINVPPGTTKSSLISILFPAWAWVNYPQLRIITSSFASDLSVSHAQKSRDIIESMWFQDFYGDKFIMKHDLNRTKEYENDHTGIRIATSVGGSITGRHADIFIVDDPLNPKKAASAKEIVNANEWWDKTASTRLRDQSVSLKIIVMQRLHENDLTGYCLSTKEGEYEHICLPGEVTEDVKPLELRVKYQDGILDPSRHGRPILDKMKLNLGSYGYAGQILQNPIPAEGNLIKKKWFGRFDMSKLREKAKDKKEELTWNYVLDGAYTKDQQNDPSAIMCFTVLGNEMYVRSIQSVWKELPDLIKFIREFVARNGYLPYSRIYIEPKASGLSAAQTLKRETDLNVIIDKAPTVDKVARVNSVSAFLEAGRCHLLEDANWIDHFLNQCAAFPNGKHDDEVDCLTMAIGGVIENPNKILETSSY